MNFDSILMFKNNQNNLIKYNMMILLVLIVLSCLYSLDSSNGVDIKGNNSSAIVSGNDIDSLGNVNDSNKNNVSTLYRGSKQYNESSNVILEFRIHYLFTLAQIGGYSTEYVSLNLSLRYKDNDTPLSNQTVYLIVGNETRSFITDENGIFYLDRYHPGIYGNVNFEILFNGSQIYYNDSMIDLVPVSVFMDYYFFKTDGGGCPPVHIVPIDPKYWWDTPIYPFDKISENTTGNNSKKDNFHISNKTINDIKKADSHVDYGKMKETSVPLMQLLLLLIATSGIFIYRKR